MPNFVSSLAILSIFGLSAACEKASPEPKHAKDEINSAVESLEAAAFTDEKEARRFENEGIVPFWNQLLATPADERLKLLAAVPLKQLQLGKLEAEQSFDLGIKTQEFTSGGKKIDASAWGGVVAGYRDRGYTLVHSDWHHAAFERTPEGGARSEITFKLQGTSDRGSNRLEIKGRLGVRWHEDEEQIRPAVVEVLSATIASRSGATGFEQRAVIEGRPDSSREGLRSDIGAIAVYDLDNDQLPEILLGNANRILWNRGNFNFDAAPLIPEDGRVFRSVVGLVGDFNGDSLPDWICDTKIGALALYKGKFSGGFTKNPRRIDLGEYALKIPSCLSAGDIDNDGDLDLFVGQWRSLYDQMPEKFWDANDGFGNTLLLNDGLGNFTDATESLGLGSKRKRRTYSASFIDLDDDHDLDLIVVSDFYGTDAYLNDGSGKFTDATAALIDQPHAFGMSHTVADYDGDGRTDLFVLGMGSTTARRLERMGANPKGHPETNSMRAVMGFGNRMYLSKDSTLSAPKFIDQVARTGWSWGSTSADFDNDGDQDIYIANGHISGNSTQDYCTNFWCRDIYVLQGRPAQAIDTYLNLLPNMQEQSWDGYQVNPLLINQGGSGFEDFGFLLDVGFNFDARHVISADLDLDGRVDLLVDRMQGTSGFFNNGKGKAELPALYILQNTLSTSDRNWIGVTIPMAAGRSSMGATVELLDEAGAVLQSGVMLSGDSFASQHPSMKHFGLDDSDHVAALRVTLVGGKTVVLKNPETKRYHSVPLGGAS